MLTPCFDIEQNEEFVIVSIRVPYAKVRFYWDATGVQDVTSHANMQLSEAEFFIEGCSFKFYCKPYFLR